MRLLILLLFVSNFAIAQKHRGFQVSFEYGVDRNISGFYDDLPQPLLGSNNTSIRSRHPLKVSVDYFITKGKFRYHLNGNIINRTLQPYYPDNNVASGYTNHTMYAFGVGASRICNIKEKYEYELGLDLLAGYYDRGLTVISGGGGSGSGGASESFRIYDVQFRSYGIDGGSIIPMFNLYNQIAIPIAPDTNLLIGFGLNGQMNKAYSFDVNVIDIIMPEGQFTSTFYVGKDFFMWFPYLKVGIQI